MSDFKEKTIFNLLNGAAGGDLGGFVQAHLLNDNGYFHEQFIESDDGPVLQVSAGEKIEPIMIPAKALHDFDPEFFAEEYPDVEWQKKELEPVPTTVNEEPAPYTGITEEQVKSAIKEIFVPLCDSLYKKVQENTEESKSFGKSLQDSFSTINRRFDRIDSLLKNSRPIENEDSKRRIEVLEAENAKLRESASSASDVQPLKKEIEELRGKVLTLTELAYNDRKFQVKNNNALNEKLRDIKKGDLIAKLSICGLKAVNDEYGTEKGDILIGEVVKALKERFTPTEIYRVQGDVFFVIPENQKDEKTLYSDLSIVRDSLKNIKIRTVFDAQTFNGKQTFKDMDENIKTAKNTREQRIWNMAEPVEEEDEDDGFREEDGLNLLQRYSKQ